MRAALWDALEPKLASVAIQRDPDARMDAPPPPADGDVSAAVEAARKAVRESLDGIDRDVNQASRIAAERADRHSRRESARIGIKLADAEPSLSPLVSRWRRENVERITGMAEDQLGKVERILRDGANHRVETVAKQIERQLDVTSSRAELIARDQVLTLNAQITKERQAAAGIEQYVWTTSNDERVREEHQALEGRTFSWDDPPDVGHPGEDYQCRCTAFPILPELEEVEGSPATAEDEPPRSNEAPAELPEAAAPPPVDDDPTNIGRLPNNLSVDFQPHERQRSFHTTIMVDRAALDASWSKDTGAYIPAGGGGAEIAGRRDNFRRFLERPDRPPIQASRVAVDEETGAARFVDGRHRFSMLRDMGIDRVAITVEKRDLKHVPSHWNATPLKKRRQRKDRAPHARTTRIRPR